MRDSQGNIILSAYDLVGHLNCRHLTGLDLSVAKGTLAKPSIWDPLLEILRERGYRHEQAFVSHLEENGFKPVKIDGIEISDEAVTATNEAIKDGTEIIIQAALRHGRWNGRADILRRVDKPSGLGNWSYEVIDTKLARETRGGTVLQLCLYADLIEQLQGTPPDHVHVVSPWSDFEPQTFRYADFAAFYRRAKLAAEQATLGEELEDQNYPDPKDHCDICRWRHQCDDQRRADDHLCLVAGISKTQTAELKANGIATAKALSEMPSPMPWKPDRGSPHSYEKIKQQARIQVDAREAGELKYEILNIEPGTGLCMLPEPSDGDIFFDLEGDQFVGEYGLEYLFGYRYRDSNGEMTTVSDWAFDRTSERDCFERFLDFVEERKQTYPDLHIYHFAPYEPAALKRLMGRYATRELEVDNLLRGERFVDLYSVIRHAIRASVESYSIKMLEPFFGFERSIPLGDANLALSALQAGLELNDIPSISDQTKEAVAGYNADDCAATEALRDWLEGIRAEQIETGVEIERPPPGKEGPSEELSEQQQRVQELIGRMTHDVPIDPEERTNEQQARWILAHILEWHRREDKATWWEYFRLSDLPADDLIDERAGLAHLTLIGEVDRTARGILTHRYVFPQQDTDLRGDEDLHAVGGEKLGKVIEVSTENRTIDIKKSGKTADIHPDGVFSHTIFRTNEQAAALFRIGEYVADNGITGEGPYRSARDLLLRELPPLNGQPLRNKDETPLAAALRISPLLDAGFLPIQGPPGTGKSFTGARMVCQLVSEGKKVGITANSHKVIRNLIDKVLEAADEMNVDLCCVQKPKEIEADQDHLIFAKNNGQVFNALGSNAVQVAGATHYLWSRADAYEVLDVLVVDEAAQMSLANVLAVSHAAKTLILLGDPQQLDQPTQGSHPDGTGVSALDHVLDGKQTIAPEQGLFLEETWRLHPEICTFNSELFYEEKLTTKPECAQQVLISSGSAAGSGLRYIPVHHYGNKSSSPEEADVVRAVFYNIMKNDTRWTDREGVTHPISFDDIVIIAPYNAQVFEIQQRLPQARVGTVDKFQGQEAPIAIYSLATSSHSDAPRGMEFLYSANRLNVAISRAKCMSILVASPDVFEAECKTPRQMQLANAFCRYLEVSEDLAL